LRHEICALSVWERGGRPTLANGKEVFFMLRKFGLCLFYALCAFAISFSLLWMALPALTTRSDPAASQEDSATAASSALPALLAQTVPQSVSPAYYLCDKGGRVAVYACEADGGPGELVEWTDIYVNLLPERDALRLKEGFTVQDNKALASLLEDLGG
jgi:hypothetical protein